MNGSVAAGSAVLLLAAAGVVSAPSQERVPSERRMVLEDRVLRQDPFPTALAGFDMTLARTPKGVSMTCDKGCAWKTLSFSSGARPAAVNELGMAGDKTDNPERAGHFLLRVGIKDNAFALSCDRGCAWRTLGWPIKDETPVRVNEYGMSAKK